MRVKVKVPDRFSLEDDGDGAILMETNYCWLRKVVVFLASNDVEGKEDICSLHQLLVRHVENAHCRQNKV